MNETILKLLIKKLTDYKPRQIEKTLEMLLAGDTVPFIARYRKEVTGNLDEVAIHTIFEEYKAIETLEKRKETVLKAIEEQGKLTEKLKGQILSAEKMQLVEDLYLPYKQKRRTKATIAKERGLEPLAKAIWENHSNIEQLAEKFLNKEVTTAEEALKGAHEIIAEEMGENAKMRQWTFDFTNRTGLFISKEKDKTLDEKSVFEMYYDFSEPVSKVQNHRILAVNRGEKEGILSVTLEVNTDKIFQRYHQEFVKKDNPYLVFAYQDAYKRFIKPAIERQIRNELTGRADESAIGVFGENLKNLLLQSPLKNKVILGFDPAYRTGAKLAVISPTGKLLDVAVIYPVKPAKPEQIQAAKREFIQLIEKHKVEMIAIGNGTASRESELFVADCLKEVKQETYYTIVNEAGASIYSASEVARNEFPDLTVEKRSAISIARRLQDPLAELVKIEPKAIGVGQYQHDVSQKRLSEELDFVVETAVNQVGVDVNTASPQLLQHIAGLNKTTAENLVRFRDENEEFASRAQLKKVPRLGPKAYEQAIGFLRIPDAKNILDATSIHPESYPSTKLLLETLNIPLKNVQTQEAKDKLKAVNTKEMAEKLEIGQLTLQDIIAALLAPGRDMRSSSPKPILRTDVMKAEDLQVGMKMKGTVRNVVDFGAFVDIGVKEDGLVHLSKMAKKYVKHPSEIVSVGDVVDIWIDGIDNKRGRISLSMVEPNE